MIHDDIDDIPDDVTGEDLGDLALLAALAKPDVVDEAAVAAAGVDQVELALLEHDHSMLS